MKRLLLGLAVAGLLLPTAALGGGFATVQLSSLPRGPTRAERGRPR
jgi:hypothetical protein